MLANNTQRVSPGSPPTRSASRSLTDACFPPLAVSLKVSLIVLRFSSRLRFGLGYGSTSDAATEQAEGAMRAAIGDAVNQRLTQYAHVPAVDAAYQQLLNKAVSVMRVNALSPEGGIAQRWSTPDRVPHQWMWLWDSCYHSMAINELQVPSPSMDAQGRNGGLEAGFHIGWDYLKSVLDAAAPDGAIAIERTPTSVGTKVTQTQPPLLAWAVWENFLAANASDPELAAARLAYAFPELEGYINWDRANRKDPTGKTPLLVWTKGTESGMDNSQRFDLRDVPHMLAVDFSVFLARECALLARIASVLGNETAAAQWNRTASEVSTAIHETLWDAEAGLYGDLEVKRGFTGIKAVTAFLPLWLPDIPTARVATLLSKMQDPKTFATPVPLPSVSLDTELFSTDMWRGPMWLNTNYMVALALSERGEDAAARKLMQATVDCVLKYYNK